MEDIKGAIRGFCRWVSAINSPVAGRSVIVEISEAKFASVGNKMSQNPESAALEEARSSNTP